MATTQTTANDELCHEERARELLGEIGHTKYYELIKDGELRSVRIGRRRFVPRSEIDRFIAKKVA